MNLSSLFNSPKLTPEYFIYKEEKEEKDETRIVSVFIRDRLGNHFFQIISAWAYAKKYDMKFVLSESYQKKYPLYYNKFFSKIPLIDKFVNFTINQYLMYDKIINNKQIYNSKRSLIYSYLQNSKNFDCYRDEILNFFFNINEVKPKNNKFFIHIRLTDFLSSPMHNFNMDNYYKKAIEYLYTIPDKLNIDETIFYIISDDINKAKTKNYLNLLPNANLVFIDNKEYDDLKTLELCSDCCSGAIISHSTFGWWGAYIINCPEKIVVCPDRFIRRNSDFSGFYLNYKIISI